MVLDSVPDGVDRVNLFELLPDGTIERYFVDPCLAVYGTARRLDDRRTRSPTSPPRPSSLT